MITGKDAVFDVSNDAHTDRRDVRVIYSLAWVNSLRYIIVPGIMVVAIPFFIKLDEFSFVNIDTEEIFILSSLLAFFVISSLPGLFFFRFLRDVADHGGMIVRIDETGLSSVEPLVRIAWRNVRDIYVSRGAGPLSHSSLNVVCAAEQGESANNGRERITSYRWRLDATDFSEADLKQCLQRWKEPLEANGETQPVATEG